MSKKKKLRKADAATIRRVMYLIRPYRLSVAATLVLAAVTVISTLYAPVLTGRGVDLIVGPGNVDFTSLLTLGAQLVATILITVVAQWLMNLVNNRITFQVVRDIRVKAFEHMQVLPLSYMDAHRPGDAISRITTDVEKF